MAKLVEKELEFKSKLTTFLDNKFIFIPEIFETSEVTAVTNKTILKNKSLLKYSLKSHFNYSGCVPFSQHPSQD